MTLAVLPEPDPKQLGFVISSVVALLVVIFGFILKYAALKNERSRDPPLPSPPTSPSPLQHSVQDSGAVTNGKSGDRAVSYWEGSIREIVREEMTELRTEMREDNEVLRSRLHVISNYLIRLEAYTLNANVSRSGKRTVDD